ncbi:tellurite resistance TerB family protein [Neptunomonas japonica]|uniref:tellurite resistance TerB family protein n=1 Tax=Neptunomonas japonica TaxID=417574 RepID=UPI0003F632AF|nr:tellurite resistance TerB family protein [Neptunomonas japonica]
MDTRNLLDQLLKSGTDFLQNKNTNSTDTTGKLQDRSALGDLLSGTSGGVLAGGVLGLLLGSKKGRKIGGKVLTYGSLAALGTVAYKAYNNWQEQQDNSSAPAARPINALPAQEAENHSRAVLCAMIGAAKADGHIDEHERQLIDQGIAGIINDPELQHWFEQELHKPLDPADIARNANSPEMAAEMYLASLLVIDEDSFMEKAYLEELARQLKFEPALKAELEAQAHHASQTN